MSAYDRFTLVLGVVSAWLIVAGVFGLCWTRALGNAADMEDDDARS